MRGVRDVPQATPLRDSSYRRARRLQDAVRGSVTGKRSPHQAESGRRRRSYGSAMPDASVLYRLGLFNSLQGQGGTPASQRDILVLDNAVHDISESGLSVPCHCIQVRAVQCQLDSHTWILLHGPYDSEPVGDARICMRSGSSDARTRLSGLCSDAGEYRSKGPVQEAPPTGLLLNRLRGGRHGDVDCFPGRRRLPA